MQRANKRKWFNDKAVWSWASYDAAASGFTTVVMATFFPVLFKDYWGQGADSIVTTARLGTLVSIAGLAVALSAPLLGAMADQRGMKKRFLIGFAVFALLCCAGLALIQQGHWLTAAIIYAGTLFGFYAANTFYDSLLPGISQRHTPELVSSFGYGLGYLSGGVLLIIAILVVSFHQALGLTDKTIAIKACFIGVAIWWLAWLLVMYRGVPETSGDSIKTPLWHLFVNGWRRLWQTLKAVRQHKDLALFLLAYWFFIDAVFSVILMAVDYGISIGFKPLQLVTAILLTQFVGFPSAVILGLIGRRYGCKKIIIGAILLYGVVVIWASQMHHIAEFFILAGLVGIGQGAIQALSRALVAKMIPLADSAQYFGFFNMVNKFSAVLGPVLMGWATVLLHSHREGILALLVLLAIGLILLWRVNEPAPRR